MNIKQTTLVAALAGVFSLGVAGQAAASVYAGSYVDIQDLTIQTFEGGTQLFPTINSFQFSVTNTATLNGVSAATQSATCGGTIASNSCSTSPTLDANAANAPGGAPVRVNNDFSLFGPSADQYSNSDSVIWTSELTSFGANPTHTTQISESELQGGSDARANAEITSLTSISMLFDVAADSVVTIDFSANPYLRALINDPVFDNGSAVANLQVLITLAAEDGSGEISWSPEGNGTGTNDCKADFGTCVETDDTQDLHRTISVSTNGSDSSYSNDGFGSATWTAFGIRITGLSSGTYNLTLDALTSTVLRRVPEPGMLALMGMGLLGMGVAGRRRKARG